MLQEALRARKMERQISASVKIANTCDTLCKAITNTVAETAGMERRMVNYARNVGLRSLDPAKMT